MSRSHCANCNASRGLAKYDNGTWCFACSTYTSIRTIHTSIFNSGNIKYNKNFKLVQYLTKIIPGFALKWLAKYYITQKHINKYNIQWECVSNRIAFPYYVKNDLIFTWLRGIMKERNKWIFSGRKDSALFYLQTNKKHSLSRLVIVEDVVSAIRVADYSDVVALGGTNFHSSLLVPLFLQYEELVVFLDGDKAGKEAAIKFKKRFHLLRKVRIIKTKIDPKEYKPKELEEILK